ncbi:hypothetical protein A2U01_0043948, partial [Trifolium medium]|nr:hypothetical protein [Trifolium medium]
GATRAFSAPPSLLFSGVPLPGSYYRRSRPLTVTVTSAKNTY